MNNKINNKFKYSDLIIKLPSLKPENINMDIKTIINTNINNKHEENLHNKIEKIGYDKFKGVSVLVNPYSLINLNNVDLGYLKKTIRIGYVNKCKEKKKILTRAYYKLWEVIDHFKLLDGNYPNGFVSSNVAEGPGGFIQAVIYYRIINNDKKEYLKDKVYGISLKVSGNLDFTNADKVNNKFREIYEKRYNILNISYGGDDGDLTKIKVIKNYVNQFKDKKADLFTGDGGIVANSSLDKEILNGQLILCEAIVGLAVLKKGGHFVLKTYTLTLPFNIELLQLLSSYFEEFYITKPVTSRIFNTEKYIVGKNFKGIKEEELEKLFKLVEILKDIENQGKYIYSFFSNSIDKKLENQIKQFNNTHYGIRLRLFNIIDYILKNNNNTEEGKRIIQKYKKILEYTSYKWCKKMKLNFLIEE